MKTLDEITKLKAAVLYILQQIPCGLDYIHLFKMLYFAQQEHLVIYGMPLIDDTFVARKHGPVPTLTHKVLRMIEGKATGNTKEVEDFANALCVIVQDGHQIVKPAADAVCDKDELSISNLKVLDKWIAKCKDMESFNVSDLSHDKAWKRAKRQAEKTGEDSKITLFDMAEAGGATPDMLAIIRERQINKKALS